MVFRTISGTLAALLRERVGDRGCAGPSPVRDRRRQADDGVAVSGPGQTNENACRTISLFTEVRFGLDHRGDWAAMERAYGAGGWSRYTRTRCELRLVARAQRRLSTGLSPVGSVAAMAPLPYYVGVRGLASALPRLGVAIVREVVRAEIVVLRLPGMIGFLAAYACRILGRRYAVEVVGDPVAVLASGSLGRTGRLLAPFAGWQMRRVVSGASAALYVTQSTLQRRYPTARRVPVTGVSTVRIDETAFVDKGRRWRPGPPRIVTVGSQEVRYKGHDVLLHAIQRLHSAGAPVTAVIVGDGRLHGDLVDLAVNLGIRECVTFTGAIHDRAELMAQLDQATLFVLPSRTEGLPRALIEAMARALPAVASDVGGISELLEAEFLVPVEDPAALADRISALGSDPARWEAQSKRNLEVSRAYHAAALDARFDHWLSGIPVARHRGQP